MSQMMPFDLFNNKMKLNKTFISIDIQKKEL